MAAGHNALRRSGPGQKHAVSLLHWLKWVVPIFGSTARCIIRLVSFPTSLAQATPARVSNDLGLRLLVECSMGHHRPGGAGDLVGQRDGRDLGRAALQ